LEDLLRVVAPERRAATADLVAGLRTYIESARSREQEFILALPRLRAIALTLMALFSPGVDPNVLKQSVLDALPADEVFVGA